VEGQGKRRVRHRRYAAALEQAEEKRDEFYVMCKTGGPYLRAATMRGDEDFWMDIADDPSWARAFVDRVAEHITTVGVESIRRFDLRDTGIAIYDDVASNRGVFVGPATYEAVFLPALRRMVRAYREAGATKIMHHSDGDVSLLLDMWIDAGIDAINPVEYRAGMDPVAIRRKYGEQLVCVGGLDNAAILPRGDRVEIRDHINHLMEASAGGGFIIAPHFIGPDISVETFEYVVELLDELGTGE
jgi:uroporphyrinogen decarboxylase